MEMWHMNKLNHWSLFKQETIKKSIHNVIFFPLLLNFKYILQNLDWWFAIKFLEKKKILGHNWNVKCSFKNILLYIDFLFAICVSCRSIRLAISPKFLTRIKISAGQNSWNGFRRNAPDADQNKLHQIKLLNIYP